MMRLCSDRFPILIRISVIFAFRPNFKSFCPMSQTNLSDAEISFAIHSHNGGVIQFRNSDFYDCSSLDTMQYDAVQLSFYNCTFNKKVVISNKCFEKGVIFIDCVFNAGLYLKEIYYKNSILSSAITINNCTSRGDIHIHNCKQNEINISVTCEKDSLVFSENKSLNSVHIHQTKVRNLALISSGTKRIIVDKLNCSNFHFGGNLYNEFQIMDSDVKFSINSLFNSEKLFETSTIAYDLIFQNSTIRDSFITIEPDNKKVRLEFTHITFSGQCRINTKTEPLRRFGENEDQGRLSYYLQFTNNNSQQPIYIGGLTVGDRHSVSIQARKDNNAIYEIIGAQLRSLEMNGDWSNTYLNVDRIKILKGLAFCNFIGNEKSKISTISTASESAELILINSDFSKTIFSNIDFEKFKKVIFKSTQIRNAVLNNIIWFKHEQIEFLDIKRGSLEYIIESRQLYQQLKQSAEKNDDKHTALYFHSMEEKFHLKELLRSTSKSLLKSKLMAEVIRLLLKWTNDFGNNWLRPILCLLILSLFSSILLSLVSFSNEVELSIYNQLFLFVQLINPTHSLKEIVENSNGTVKLGFGTYLIDILHKALTTFLIFQTITAFRRQHT